MMIRRSGVVAALSLLLLGVLAGNTAAVAAVGDSTSPHAAPANLSASDAGVEFVTGKVKEGVEDGCLLLTAATGTYLLRFPDGVPEKVKVGATVTVTGKVDHDSGSTCMQGIPFVVAGATDPPAADAETLTGTAKSGVEFDCLILATESTTYPLDISPELAAKFTVGMTVTVTGHTPKHGASTCQEGVPFVVSGVLDAIAAVTDPPRIPSERLTGKVSAGEESGCFLLTTTNGTSYLLQGRQDLAAYLTPGLVLKVVGRTDRNLVTTCQEGVPFVVSFVADFADPDVNTLTGTVMAGGESSCPILKTKTGTYLLIASGELAEKVTPGTTVTVTGETDMNQPTSCKAGLPFIVETAQ